MAALRSTRRGDRAIGIRDWLTSYGATWLLPVPIGLAMMIPAILWRWPFEALGWAIPADAASACVFGAGMVVIFVPAFSWSGLIVSVPAVWLVLRLGFGGWLSFALGGVTAGVLAAVMLGGMAAPVPVSIGVLSALALRRVLLWLQPSALVPRTTP